MERKRFVTGILSAVGICVLILDGQTAIQGCRAGLSLCAETVIPSLFPFFWLNGLLNGALLGYDMGITDRLGALFGYPKGCASIMISSLLGGYPSGAQAVGQCCKNGKLSNESGELLLSVSNNAGPAFLFGMAGQMFPDRRTAWVLWFVQIVSSVFVAQILLPKFEKPLLSSSDPYGQRYTIEHSIQAILRVCGWIVLFRGGMEILRKRLLNNISDVFYTLIAGFLEISNGCFLLSSVEDIRIRFILCTLFLAFGGLCVTMQTVSVVEGLNMRYYFIGKAMQTGYAVLLACILAFRAWVVGAVVIFLYILAVIKKKKYYSNLSRVRV